MQFLPHTFRITGWEPNLEIISMVQELQELGVGFRSSDQPYFQPMIETLKNKSLPIAFLNILWGYDILNSNNELVLKYTATDKYQFNTNFYIPAEVNELVNVSYSAFQKGFDVNNQQTGIYPGIRPLEQDEYDQIVGDIKQFLKQKGI